MKIDLNLPHDVQVHSVVNKMNGRHPSLREDLIQVGRIAVLQALSSYDPKKGEQNYWVRQYIIRDVLRAIADEDKRNACHFDIAEIIDMDDVDELIDYDVPENLQKQIDLFECVERLPEETQELMIMHFWQDMSYQEIADEKGLHKQSVWRIVTNGTEEIRQMIS